MPINWTTNAYSYYWQPVCHFYVLAFQSKLFETSQFLSHHYTHYLHDKKRRSITYQHFQPGIYGINIREQVLVFIAWHSHHTLSSSCSSISMTSYKQFSISWPCVGGLSRELSSWLHGLMQSDGCHLLLYWMWFDCSFYELYDITDVKFVSKFHLKCRFCFII